MYKLNFCLDISTSTTARPRPPWFPESPPKSWVDLAPSSTTTPSLNATEPPPDDSEDIENEHDYASGADDKVIQVKVPKPLYPVAEPSLQSQRDEPPAPQLKDIDGRHVHGLEDGNPMIALNNFTHYCPPITARGLYWNWTVAGETAVLECPPGSVGFAKWRCGREPSADWSPLSPSLAECRSKWLNNLEARLRDGEAVGTVSGDLAQLSGLQPLYGGDLRLAGKMMKHMAERMNYDIQVNKHFTFIILKENRHFKLFIFS